MMSVVVYYRHFSLVYTCRENCKQNILIKLGNTSFGSEAMVMYWGVRVKNQNSCCWWN